MLNPSQTSSRMRKERNRWGRVKWRNKIKLVEGKEIKKMSNGQLSSKHGDKSHKNGCNDE